MEFATLWALIWHVTVQGYVFEDTMRINALSAKLKAYRTSLLYVPAVLYIKLSLCLVGRTGLLPRLI